MLKRTLIGLALLAVPCFAGIRSNERTPKRLEIGGISHGSGWTISSPTLRSSSGYLAYDVSGKSPKVTYDEKQGRHTMWTFVGERRYHEEFIDKGSKRGTDLEQRGIQLTIKAASGPFAGWYLGQEDGVLTLVKDPKRAATIVLVEKEADIVHK